MKVWGKVLERSRWRLMIQNPNQSTGHVLGNGSVNPSNRRYRLVPE